MKIIEEFNKTIYHKIEKSLIKNDIKDILNKDGRKNNSPAGCKNKPTIYILYSKKDEVLYIGESGKSLKTRCSGDGSGSHNKKDWWEEVEYVKYLINNEFCKDEKVRKFLEQSLSITLKPKYYGRSKHLKNNVKKN
ncbi:hypothetical protein CRV03_08220 [Arcobacter sp. F155]|uniref:hypothetical protein n=1 Tax=Arcobacter sp. F155 TaxID=2044512 RepID=UPI00100C0054|nr:hypothetical protein [Arcobacter sp. F155]RXJ76816.1 hypothetical protein CRV03_08220 [Arcobacter sp. F155]